MPYVPELTCSPYYPPPPPPPPIQFNLPPFKNLCSVVDKMKSISDKISIQATSSGTLILNVATLAVEIRTVFDGLQVDEGKSSSKEEVTAILDAKKLHRVLYARLLHPEIMQAGRVLLLALSLPLSLFLSTYLSTYLYIYLSIYICLSRSFHSHSPTLHFSAH